MLELSFQSDSDVPSAADPLGDWNGSPCQMAKGFASVRGQQQQNHQHGRSSENTLVGGSSADRFATSTGKDSITDLNPGQSDQIQINPNLNGFLQQDGNRLILLDEPIASTPHSINRSLLRLNSS